MTTVARVFTQSKTLEDAVTTQYTSSGVKSIIDGVSATNYSAAPKTLTVHLCQVGTAASSDNMVVKARTILAGATDLLPELRGRRLDAGDFVATDAEDGTSIAFRMEGRIST